MSDTKKEATHVSQSSESSADETKAPSMEGLSLDSAFNESSQSSYKKESTDSNDADVADQGDAESSEAEETSAQAAEQVSEASEDDSQASQSDDTDETSTKDKEKDQGSTERLSKLEKSYRSLEAEFHRRNQQAKQTTDDLRSKNEEIQALQNKIAELSGQTKKSSKLDEVRKTNPDAAALLEEAIREETEKVKQEFKEKFEELQNLATKDTKEKNVNVFREKIATFPFPSLEKEFLEVVQEAHETQEAILEEASNNPKLYDQLYKEFVARNYKKVALAEMELEKANEKPSSKSRDKDIAKSKGAGKSHVSDSEEASEDWSDLSDPAKYRRAPKKHQKAWEAKNGFGPNDPIGNFRV